MSDLITDMMHQATHDAALFRTYDDDFEVIDRDQVMRCLANLDLAIKKFNMLHEIVVINCIGNENVEIAMRARLPIDAIFTALRIVQDNLKAGVEHEAEKVLESKREMAAIGGDRE